jgi:hypothetical protein
MDLDDIFKTLLTSDGKSRASWILLRSGLLDKDDLEFCPEEPIVEESRISEDELNIFDTIETMLFYDEFDRAYTLAMNAVRELMNKGRFESALYVCQMIGDDILRREILKTGLRYYESRGDFKRATNFAEMLGDIERAKVYKYLYNLYCQIVGSKP